MPGKRREGSFKPKYPFSRPSIDLGKHGRVWDDVMVGSVEPDDVVAGVGLISRVEYEGESIKLVSLFGEEKVFDRRASVKAFVKRSDDDPR